MASPDWKTYHERLPLPNLLNLRGCNVYPNCVLCHLDSQDPNHIFLNCPFSQQIWQTAGLLNSNPSTSVISIIDSLLLNSRSNSRTLVLRSASLCYILWYIWCGYWDYFFEQVPFAPHSILLKAIREAKDLCFHLRHPLPRQPRLVSWTPPPPFGFLKFNVDGASKGNPGPAGIGGVCRDHNSTFISCFSAGIGQTYAILAEALAIRHALLLATNMRASSIIVESDNLTVIGILIGKVNSCPWRISKIIDDCRHLASTFGSVVFCHSLREANAAADARPLLHFCIRPFYFVFFVVC
ncbi:uncharacterized protein LOC122078943 [Macadamia integrifolia]|uniref:uncharacterized protein LOC122078943 n=1 Tax=Macadamia integrifolia TaxID=60698 RepID=UPI001C4F26C3|nr:uncharacterized protein LOC122078943 [Macadamia integrifolia]XP_042501083.1 uncharacterized protein LOC122078943 [Macadamia integrifolia]